MSLFKRKPKVLTREQEETIRTKSFFDCVAPSTIRFYADRYIVANYYCCVWAIKEYPPVTEEQAILAQLADRSGVTLRMYHRLVEPIEQDQIINHANRKNRLMAGDNNLTEAVHAAGNLQDVVTMLSELRKNHEVLLHCAVYIELRAKSEEALRNLQADIAMELSRSKITVDKLTLRQREGFLSVMPLGSNQFGPQFERVLPANSVANMFPFNFSGRTDPAGFYLGRDKFGTNIIVDLDHRSSDKTNGSVLALGNSGIGKSYLVKLLLTILRQAGKSCICLDAEGEYEELTHALGGTYLDLLSGRYIINILQPKIWSDDTEPDEEAPEAFRCTSQLSQHIAFLKDFFRVYKGFSPPQLDTLEILLEKLYAEFRMRPAKGNAKGNKAFGRGSNCRLSSRHKRPSL